MNTLFERLAAEGPVLAPPVVTGMGTAMAGGKGRLATTPRRANDFYPTPPEATRALLAAEADYLAGDDEPIWEPCGRGGAIIAELRRAGFSAIGTDIVGDPEHDVEQADLFEIRRPRAKRAITNPPFALSAKMIVHLLSRLDVDYLALLLKATYWHAGVDRGPLFRQHRPARIYALTWRLDFIDGGAPVMECCWMVWDKRHTGPTTYDTLDRPGDAAAIGDLF